MHEQERFVIYRYTAAEAVQDGVLFDVDPALSREAGYAIPVRITRGVQALVAPAEEREGESAEGRLWDTLSTARIAIQNAEEYEWAAPFDVQLGEQTVRLWACLDTTSGPAIHIIKPEEY